MPGICQQIVEKRRNLLSAPLAYFPSQLLVFKFVDEVTNSWQDQAYLLIMVRENFFRKINWHISIPEGKREFCFESCPLILFA